MKAPHGWIIRSLGSKIMMGLVLAAMIGGMNVAPAIGDDDHNRRGKHGDGRYEHRGRGHDRYHYVNGRRVYYQPVYRERVYVAPPPVYYAPPPPPPGITIFLPPLFHR